MGGTAHGSLDWTSAVRLTLRTGHADGVPRLREPRVWTFHWRWCGRCGRRLRFAFTWFIPPSGKQCTGRGHSTTPPPACTIFSLSCSLPALDTSELHAAKLPVTTLPATRHTVLLAFRACVPGATSTGDASLRTNTGWFWTSTQQTPRRDPYTTSATASATCACYRLTLPPTAFCCATPSMPAFMPAALARLRFSLGRYLLRRLAGLLPPAGGACRSSGAATATIFLRQHCGALL